ncbi:MAG: hypothetical protein P0116_13530 [Candidatus Nitrosocosmicus sp.]|nr:hypothetical protein [Candidatus Nitrosocosmicus sp.]
MEEICYIPTFGLYQPSEDALLVGDSASVIDPLSSHGVIKNIMSGMMAGHLIIKMDKARI